MREEKEIIMKRTILITITICMLLLCACQPTPTEEAVINRLDGTLEKAIRQKPVDPYTYEAPARWDETYTVRNQEIRISADVQVPDAQRFPVTTIKRHTLTFDEVQSFLNGFCPGEWSVRENEYSREELMVDLENAAKGEYMGEDEETGEIIWKPLEDEMKRIQKLIEETPVEDTYVPFTADRLSAAKQKVQLKDSTGTTWYLWFRGDDLSLTRYRDGNLQPEDWVLLGDATPGERPHALENIRISEEEAIEKGDAVIAALGMGDFRLAEVKRARMTQSYSYKVYGEGYQLTYVPALEGTVPCFYEESSEPDFFNFDAGISSTYAFMWRQEDIQMFVTDEGVLSLGWADVKEHVLTANENVQLMAFSDIRKCLKKLIEYCVGGNGGSPILITRIYLTTAIAQIPDQGDEAFLVPAWAFFVTSEQERELHIDETVLLLNALDGTYVNRFFKEPDGLPDVP